MSRKARVAAILLVATGAALLITAAVGSLRGNDRVAGENAPTPCLVATRFIPAGTPFDETMFGPAAGDDCDIKTTMGVSRVTFVPAYMGGRVAAADIPPGTAFQPWHYRAP